MRVVGGDLLLHVFDVPAIEFRLGEVSKTCGVENLYYDQSGGGNPMRVEQLFSTLEGRVSLIFRKIVNAVADDCDHLDILEKDVHTLFKFMPISMEHWQPITGPSPDHHVILAFPCTVVHRGPIAS